MATMGCIRVGRVDAEVVTIARVSGRHFRFYRSCGGKGRREVTRDVEDFQEAARFFCVFFLNLNLGRCCASWFFLVANGRTKNDQIFGRKEREY